MRSSVQARSTVCVPLPQAAATSRAYANGQAVTQAWNATVTSSGSAVTARNVSYNGALAAGAGTQFGFLGW
ncbi:cellulose binding domain-containing protein [Paractinoplanes hotanensis]|uniref:cellulose binding domain-containing protein n=1 Tax=Paractinoplanes hotanensis TaxID=2906497 RepID=UPI003F6937F5